MDRTAQAEMMATLYSRGHSPWCEGETHSERIEAQKEGKKMAVYKRGNVWWFKFTWNGELIRESTKQTNKRVAEQIEAARKTQLAKGELGIREKKPTPILEHFMIRDFLPFVRTTKAPKPNTIRFYENSVANLRAYSKLVDLPLDQITAQHIAGFVAHRQAAKVQVATLNRDLATLRRVFHLAQDWGKISAILPRLRLLPGENRRERVLTADEEKRYLDAATDIGQRRAKNYQRARRHPGRIARRATPASGRVCN